MCVLCRYGLQYKENLKAQKRARRKFYGLHVDHEEQTNIATELVAKKLAFPYNTRSWEISQVILSLLSTLRCSGGWLAAKRW